MKRARTGRRRERRRLMFPLIGERLHDRKGWGSLRVPFVAWIRYMVYAWTTPRLIAVGVLGIAPSLGLFFIGVDHQAVRLGFAITALIPAGMLAGGLLRPRIAVRSEVPVRVECGRPFSLRYRVENKGRRTACDVVVETLPYPNPLNLRLHRAPVAVLPSGQAVTVQGHGEARRRGRYVLPPLRWDTDFPMGLWRWGRTDWTSRPLTVYPRYTPLSVLDIPLGTRNRLDLNPARQLARAAIEFHGCREFRQGDALRHVHPRSSARMGVPVVKEFQAEGRGRTAVLVDTWRILPRAIPGRISDPVVEAALSLATAVVENLARSDRVLELLVAGPGVYRFVSEGRLGFFEEFLDIMAAIESCAVDPLPDLAPLLIEEIRAVQSVCLIFSRWDEKRAALARDLADGQVGVKTVLVSLRPGTPPHDAPPDTRCVSARAIRRGEVTML
jgi:uncharacterized protein (DUF58 family)